MRLKTRVIHQAVCCCYQPWTWPIGTSLPAPMSEEHKPATVRDDSISPHRCSHVLAHKRLLHDIPDFKRQRVHLVRRQEIVAQHEPSSSTLPVDHTHDTSSTVFACSSPLHKSHNVPASVFTPRHFDKQTRKSSDDTCLSVGFISNNKTTTCPPPSKVLFLSPQHQIDDHTRHYSVALGSLSFTSLNVLEQDIWHKGSSQDLTNSCGDQSSAHLPINLTNASFVGQQKDDRPQLRQDVTQSVPLDMRPTGLPDDHLTQDHGTHFSSATRKNITEFCFLDLITDEGFNRSVLQWLHGIKKQKAPLPSSQVANLVKPFVETQHPPTAASWKSSSKTYTPFAPIKMDGAVEMKKSSATAETERQAIKGSSILFICGPSCSGKSSAARILAQQAGYRCGDAYLSVESIESDLILELLIPIVKNVIEIDTSSMTAFYGKPSLAPCAPRPSLLIIDDIEEADRHAIDAFQKLMNSKPVSTSHNTTRRPIICLTNNAYHRHLKELRSNAYVLRLENFSAAKMSKRLRFICDAEHLNIDTEALLQLVDLCCGDMRLSLNILESCARNTISRTPISLEAMRRIWTMYYADRSTHEMDILQHTFTHAQGAIADPSRSRFCTYMNTLASESVDAQSLLVTLQENIHKVLFSDVFFSKTACILDLLCEADCYLHRTSSISTACLCALLFTHLYCSVQDSTPYGTSARLVKSFYAFPFTLCFKSRVLFQKRSLLKHIISSTCIPGVRAQLSGHTFAKDVAFYLLSCVVPALLFKETTTQWRQYHQLALRPSAGIPLEGILEEPLNRFHHMLELLLTYSFTYSKTIPYEFHIPGFHGTRKEGEGHMAYRTPEFCSTPPFYLHPPLHVLFESFCRHFYTSLKVSPTSTFHTTTPLPKEGTQYSINDSSTCTFSHVYASFSGYDYINLQLSRAHGDILRKELSCIVESGVLPNVPQAKATETPSVVTVPHVTTQQTSSVANVPLGQTGHLSPDRRPHIRPMLASFTPQSLFSVIEEKQRKRSLYEATSWRFSLPSPVNLPVSLSREVYEHLFDADFHTHKPFIYKYDPGDAKAVQYYPCFQELCDPTLS